MSGAFERHAADDAPSEAEFEVLLRAGRDHSDPRRRIEDVFLGYGAGRLGFRSGELLHFHEGWVDRDQKIIHVPAHNGCRCRYCRERAEDLAENHEDVDFESALEVFWKPKYRASIRPVPYGFEERGIEIVETFLDEVGYLDVSQSTINRRVNTLQDRAGIGGRLYPHALRSSAAFYLAEQGLEAHYLQAFMGWKDMRVANRYIRATGNRLANRLEQLNSTVGDGPSEEDFLIEDRDELPDPTDAVYEAVSQSNPRSDSEYHHDVSEDTSITIEDTQKTTITEFAEG